MRRYQFPITTDASGAGTATTTYPVAGFVMAARYGGTVLNNGGSADYTITRPDDGGTILAFSNTDGPWQFAPRETTYSTGGVLGGTALGGGVPVDGYIKVVVAQAHASVTDTVHLYIDDQNR